MIPPSIILIIFGVLGQVSITTLFSAAIVPGLMIAGLSSLFIVAVALIRKDATPEDEGRVSARDRLQGVITLIPVIILIGSVLVVPYSGVATPSEAGAVGVGVALAVIVATGQFSLRLIRDSLQAAVVTSAMLCSILIGASFPSRAMGYLRVPATVAAAIAARDPEPYGLILLLAVFYPLLGTFLEGTSITAMTLPITLPLAVSSGWDPVWFGIFPVVMVEMAQITPPVGFTLFILQSLSNDDILRVTAAAFPFVLVMCAAAVLLVLFPELALWLTR